jgi:hypothetical protein
MAPELVQPALSALLLDIFSLSLHAADYMVEETFQYGREKESYGI